MSNYVLFWYGLYIYTVFNCFLLRCCWFYYKPWNAFPLTCGFLLGCKNMISTEHLKGNDTKLFGWATDTSKSRGHNNPPISILFLGLIGDSHSYLEALDFGLQCNMACHSHMVKEGVCNWFQTMTNKGHIPTYVSLYDSLHISTPTYRDISTVICWYKMIQKKHNDISLIIVM
jgi:hypothetical protein